MGKVPPTVLGPGGTANQEAGVGPAWRQPGSRDVTRQCGAQLTFLLAAPWKPVTGQPWLQSRSQTPSCHPQPPLRGVSCFRESWFLLLVTKDPERMPGASRRPLHLQARPRVRPAIRTRWRGPGSSLGLPSPYLSPRSGAPTLRVPASNCPVNKTGCGPVFPYLAVSSLVGAGPGDGLIYLSPRSIAQPREE